MADINLDYISEESTIFLKSGLDDYNSIPDHADISYHHIDRIYKARRRSIWRRVIQHNERYREEYEFVPRYGKYESSNMSRLMCKVPLLDILGSKAINLSSNTFTYSISKVDVDEAGLIWVELEVRKYRGGRENTKFTKNFVLDSKLDIIYGNDNSINNKIPFGDKSSCESFLRSLYSLYPIKRKVTSGSRNNYRRDFDCTKEFLRYDSNNKGLVFLDFDNKSAKEIIEEVEEYKSSSKDGDFDLELGPVNEVFRVLDELEKETHILELYYGTAHYHKRIGTLAIRDEVTKSDKLLASNGYHRLKYGVKRLLEVNREIRYVSHFYISNNLQKEFMGGTPHILP